LLAVARGVYVSALAPRLEQDIAILLLLVTVVFMPLPPVPTLGDIRAEIDRVDAAMHALLMERSAVIERLIEVKGTSASGSAFRPAREVDVLRRVVERHTGLLPVDTVESIWRVIISTFTYVQAPHAVHADVSAGDAAVRDSARFHFGFTVPFVTHFSAADVIGAVAASRGDLGIFALSQPIAAEPWWRLLEGEGQPKIIARLPFVDRVDHPAGLPVYVVSKPLSEAAVREQIVTVFLVERWTAGYAAVLAEAGGALIASAGSNVGLSLLVSHAAQVSAQMLQARLAGAGCPVLKAAELGSHASPYRVASAPAGK
jgi:chorismate mutase-like protein